MICFVSLSRSRRTTAFPSPPRRTTLLSASRSGSFPNCSTNASGFWSGLPEAPAPSTSLRLARLEARLRALVAGDASQVHDARALDAVRGGAPHQRRALDVRRAQRHRPGNAHRARDLGRGGGRRRHRRASEVRRARSRDADVEAARAPRRRRTRALNRAERSGERGSGSRRATESCSRRKRAEKAAGASREKGRDEPSEPLPAARG